MLTPSGEHVHPRRPQIKNLINKARSISQRRKRIHSWKTKCRAHIKDRPRRPGRRSRDESNRYRARRGMTKHQEHHVEQSIPFCPQTNSGEVVSIHTDASLSSTSEPASSSSREQYFTATSFSHSVLNANEDLAGCGPVGNADNGVCLIDDAPSSKRTQDDVESYDLSALPEDGERALAVSAIHPDTEYHANLFAASEDSRDLFEEYYKKTYGEIVDETEDLSDAYWRWNQKRHDWFHENPDTHSIVWFLG